LVMRRGTSGLRWVPMGRIRSVNWVAPTTLGLSSSPSTTSVKATINRDLRSEAVGLPASVKPFCLPRLKLV
jgi:hypothetical protein